MAGRDPLTGGGACERAREWSSLRIDGELSLLEEELLERHLGACEACLAFEAGVRRSTVLLRTAELERPSRPVAVPSDRRGRAAAQGGRRLAMAAAAALALGALAGSLSGGPAELQRSEQNTEVSLLLRDMQDLRELPRTKRWLTPTPAPAPLQNPPEGVI